MNFVGTAVPLTLNMRMEKHHPHNNTFFLLKEPEDNLGLVTVNKQDLNYASFTWKVSQKIDDFFEKFIFVENFISDFIPDIMNNGGEYFKLVWLAKEFLENDRKFNYPMGIIYNLDNNLWDIHPGGSRQIIMNWFGPDEFDCFCFNTGGIQPPWGWQQIYESAAELHADYGPLANIHIALQWERVIGHVFCDYELSYTGTFKQDDPTRTFWRETEIIGNIDQKYKVNVPDVEKKGIVEINVSDPKDTYKALILAPVVDHYVDQTIEIVRKE